MGRGENQSSDTDPLGSASELEDKSDDTIEFKQIKKKHKCPYPDCNLVFIGPARLERHIRRHTGERPYKCSHEGCDKTYTNSSHLKRHMDTHKERKKMFECTECFLMLSSRASLKRHFDISHSDNKSLVCEQCDKTFTKKYQYVMHREEHAKEDRKCKVCNKTFTDYTRYKRHQKTHTESNKTYPCKIPDCKEVFPKWAMLCAHMKTQHVQDHKCPNCDKVFLNKTHMKRHAKIHKDDRPVFCCPYEKCYRFYLFKKNLDAHINSYHLGKKFYCDICNIGLCMKNKLVYHIQRYHMPEQRLKQDKKTKKIQRKKRKDAGIPKKSVLSSLVGITVPYRIEKMILTRETDIPYSEAEPKDSETK